MQELGCTVHSKVKIDRRSLPKHPSRACSILFTLFLVPITFAVPTSGCCDDPLFSSSGRCTPCAKWIIELVVVSRQSHHRPEHAERNKRGTQDCNEIDIIALRMTGGVSRFQLGSTSKNVMHKTTAELALDPPLAGMRIQGMSPTPRSQNQRVAFPGQSVQGVTHA